MALAPATTPTSVAALAYHWIISAVTCINYQKKMVLVAVMEPPVLPKAKNGEIATIIDITVK